MKVCTILLVVLIAISFSSAQDSPKAKKAQKEAKAIINKVKSKATQEENKFVGHMSTSEHKLYNELKKTANSVKSAFSKLGDQGKGLGVVFQGNVMEMVNKIQLSINKKSMKAYLDATLSIVRNSTLDPIQADINNLTIAINNNSNAYLCFKNLKKPLKAIGDNFITQIDGVIVQQDSSVKTNITSIVKTVETLRKKIVKDLKACKKSQKCGVDYYAANNMTMYGNLTLETGNANKNFTAAIATVRLAYFNLGANATALYQIQKGIIATCIKG